MRIAAGTERLGATSVMEGAIVMEAGEKVVMRRIEAADRETDGIILAVRGCACSALHGNVR